MSITKKEYVDKMCSIFKTLAKETENDDPLGTIIVFSARTEEQLDSNENFPIGMFSNIKDIHLLDLAVTHLIATVAQTQMYQDLLKELQKDDPDVDQDYLAARIAGAYYTALVANTKDKSKNISEVLGQLFHTNEMADRDFLFACLPKNLSSKREFNWYAEKNSGVATTVTAPDDFCRMISTTILGWCMNYGYDVERIASVIHADCMTARVEIGDKDNGEDKGRAKN